MEALAAVVLIAILASVAYSYYMQVSYSLVASAVCVLTFLLCIVYSSSMNNSLSHLWFSPRDLTEPGEFYRVLTSMYSHGDFFYHLFFNVLALAFLGSIFEERVGTRSFILLYLLSGLAGTLAFAAIRWGDLAAAVGASGAISGILGAFARLYPKERLSMFLMFIPLPPMRVWIIVVVFLLIQLVMLTGIRNVAVEAHIGGLVAGMLLAPHIAKIPMHRRVKKMVSQATLRKLATTPELKSIMRRIEDEELPDIKSAWIEHFLSKARCPSCGSPLRVKRDGVLCDKGHLI